MKNVGKRGQTMRTIKPVIRRETTHAELRQRLSAGKTGLRPLCLQHLIIRGFDFGRLSLRRAEIYDTVLDRCLFRKTSLPGVLLGELQAVSTDFRGADCRDADIVWSVLRDSNFDGSAFNRVYFFKCDLSLASFRDADLKGSSFVQCDLSFADFTGALLESVEFADCRIHGAKGLRESHLAYEPALYSQNNW
jgi:uncharacterized protein YjbI with pentapeptide repeats